MHLSLQAIYAQSTCTLTNANSADINDVHVEHAFVKLLRVVSLYVITFRIILTM